MEEGIFLHRIEFVVEGQVVLVLEVAGLAGPQGLRIIDDVVLVGVDILAVLPLFLLAQADGDGHELAVFVQQGSHLGFLGEIFAVSIEEQGDGGSAVRFLAFCHGEVRLTLALPLHCLRTFLPGKGLDAYLLRNHEGGVEAQSEMSDDAASLVLVFFQELACRRKGDLVDILVHLFLGHADAAVGDLDGLGLVVHVETDGQVAQFALEIAGSGKGFQLLSRIHSVCNKFAHEDIVV